MSANSQDGGQTSRKTVDKRFAAKQAARPSGCRLGKRQKRALPLGQSAPFWQTGPHMP